MISGSSKKVRYGCILLSAYKQTEVIRAFNTCMPIANYHTSTVSTSPCAKNTSSRTKSWRPSEWWWNMLFES